MDELLARQVRRRARHACEYCRMPAGFYPTVSFPIDHIIARQHGGLTLLGNLAVSCLHCNSHKGPNIAGIDPVTRKLTKLFHPRRYRWERYQPPRKIFPAILRRNPKSPNAFAAKPVKPSAISFAAHCPLPIDHQGESAT